RTRSHPFPYTTLFRSVTSKHSSGQSSQHIVHLMHVSKFTTGRSVRAPYFLYCGLRSPGLRASTMMPGRIVVHPGFSNWSTSWPRSEEHTSELQSRSDL